MPEKKGLFLVQSAFEEVRPRNDLYLSSCLLLLIKVKRNNLCWAEKNKSFLLFLANIFANCFWLLSLFSVNTWKTQGNTVFRKKKNE